MTGVEPTYDIVVVGAGPAGAVAARAAARRGASVLLADKAIFPRNKVCGGCLNRDALATLQRLGLDDLPARLGARPLHTMALADHGRAARLSLSGGVSLSRHAFDAALIEAAQQCGATFAPDRRVSLQRSEPGRHAVSLSHANATAPTRTITAHSLIVATGLGGRLLASDARFRQAVSPRACMGVATQLRDPALRPGSGELHMTFGDAGYVGLVQLEDGATNIAAAVAPEVLKRDGGPPRTIARWLTEAHWPTAALASLDAGHWQGTSRLTHRCRPVARDGIFLIGDAAGYVEPFTGEGMAWAMASGEAVVEPALAATTGWRDALARAWRRRYARLVMQRQWRCRLITACLHRRIGRRAAISIAHHAPRAAQPLVSHVTAAASGA